MLGDFLQILFIPTREDDGREFGPFCRQNLFLESSDWKDATAQGDFSGHGQISPRRNTGKCRGDRRGHRDAGGWAVLGDGSGRHMDVHVLFAEHVRVEIQRFFP